MSISELKNKREELHKKINDLYEQACDIVDVKEYFKEMERLNDELKDVCDEIQYLQPVIGYNEYVDLRIQDKFTYIIYEHNKRNIVGTIDYRKYHYSNQIGDIGYTIYDNFRGNNYAYYALCALADYLKSIGVPDFWISTNKSNLPSYKTIKKYGGNVIGEAEDFVLYECSTSRIK